MVPSLPVLAFHRRSLVRMRFYHPNQHLPVFQQLPHLFSVAQTPFWETFPIVPFAQNAVVPPNTIIRCDNLMPHSYSHTSARTTPSSNASATKNKSNPQKMNARRVKTGDKQHPRVRLFIGGNIPSSTLPSTKTPRPLNHFYTSVMPPKSRTRRLFKPISIQRDPSCCTVFFV